MFAGAGGEATVWRAECVASALPVALKVFGGNALRSFYQELRVGSSVRNSHLLELVEFYQPENCGMLVYEFCSGGSLRDLLNQPHGVGLERVVRVGLHVGDALAALHAGEFVHGDVKPENVLRRRRTRGDDWKLADLGVSIDRRTGARSSAATTGYAAPEVRDGRKTPTSDVWALGTMLAEMRAQVEWRDGDDRAATDLDALLRRATSPEPAERPSAAECRAELERMEAELRVSCYVDSFVEGDHSISNLPGDESR